MRGLRISDREDQIFTVTIIGLHFADQTITAHPLIDEGQVLTRFGVSVETRIARVFYGVNKDCHSLFPF